MVAILEIVRANQSVERTSRLQRSAAHFQRWASHIAPPLYFHPSESLAEVLR
jgi:hypothetical protein